MNTGKEAAADEGGEVIPTLVEDSPEDTLAKCADIMAFLALTVGNCEPDDVGIQNHPNARQGFFWIARAVEDALRYEGAHAPFKRGNGRSVQ